MVDKGYNHAKISLRTVILLVIYYFASYGSVSAYPFHRLLVRPQNSITGIMSSPAQMIEMQPSDDLVQRLIDSPLGQSVECRLIDSIENQEEESLIVKSLIWLCQDNPYLIVLNCKYQVDRIKLAEHLNISDVRHCRLSSMTHAEELAGCRIGTIPAIPLKAQMPVIIDEKLILESKAKGLEYIYSGSTISGKALVIHLSSYLEHGNNLQLADISTDVKETPPVSVTNHSAPALKNKPKQSALQVAVQQLGNKEKSTSFPYSTMRRLAASNETDKFMQILQLFDSLNLKESSNLNIDDPTGSGKTALHLAAWKGPLEHVHRLLDRNANINQWSTNIGNYGKTAIFYAITRCRDDVVLALLSRGAWVKIVNNKGQSPRSLAVSHLQPATLQAIEEAETGQADLAWLNFRQSNSDGGLYGDLDPRFLEESTLKYVMTQTQHYQEQAVSTDLNGVSGMKSVFPTTFEMRYTNLRRVPPAAIEDEDVAKPRSTSLNSYGEVLSPILAESTDEDLTNLEILKRIELVDSQMLIPQIPSSNQATSINDIEASSLVALYGTILSKRHVGKLLVFANLIPYNQDLSPIFNYANVQANKLTKLSWHVRDRSTRDILTETPIALQLLVGKTMFSKYGEEVTRSVCKCIAPGQRVRVLGRFSSIDDSEELLINRLKTGNTSLDFIVHDYQILDDRALTSAAGESIKQALQIEKKVKTEKIIDVIDEMLSSAKIQADRNDSTMIVKDEIPKVYHRLKILSHSNFDSVVNHHPQLQIDGEVAANTTVTAAVIADEPIEAHVHLVDSLSSIEAFREHAESLLDVSDHHQQQDIYLGIDCEWRPQRMPGVEYPVAVMQIAIKDHIFIIDMLSLLMPRAVRPRSSSGSRFDEPEEDEEAYQQDLVLDPSTVQAEAVALDRALYNIFHHPRSIILGFSLNSDLRKLHHSYSPMMSSLQHFPACLDLVTIMLKLNQSIFASNKKGRSLSKLSNEILGRYLKKNEQCSPWHQRPLSYDQITYAALDAIVLLKIYEKILIQGAGEAEQDDLRQKVSLGRAPPLLPDA
jgi:hypothetical protein